jgi:hypothetical protein
MQYASGVHDIVIVLEGVLYSLFTGPSMIAEVNIVFTA